MYSQQPNIFPFVPFSVWLELIIPKTFWRSVSSVLPTGRFYRLRWKNWFIVENCITWGNFLNRGNRDWNKFEWKNPRLNNWYGNLILDTVGHITWHRRCIISWSRIKDKFAKRGLKWRFWTTSFDVWRVGRTQKKYLELGFSSIKNTQGLWNPARLFFVNYRGIYSNLEIPWQEEKAWRAQAESTKGVGQMLLKATDQRHYHLHNWGQRLASCLNLGMKTAYYYENCFL